MDSSAIPCTYRETNIFNVSNKCKQFWYFFSSYGLVIGWIKKDNDKKTRNVLFAGKVMNNLCLFCFIGLFVVKLQFDIVNNSKGNVKKNRFLKSKWGILLVIFPWSISSLSVLIVLKCENENVVSVIGSGQYWIYLHLQMKY